MKIVGKAAFLGSLSLLLINCSFEKKEVIASIGNFDLLESDFIDYVNAFGYSVADEQIRQQFIEDWLLQQSISMELERVNPQKLNENRFKTEQSLKQLNLFELENHYLEQKVDSVVTEDEILAFYKENRDNYVQSSYIVKALYIKIPDTIPAIKYIERSFMLKNDKQRADIQKYGNLYASTFYLEEDKWIFLEELVRDMPITEEQKIEIVKSKGQAKFKDKNDVFFLNVLDFRIKKTTAPLDFEREHIVKHIKKRRINSIREEVRQKILNDVKANNSNSDY